MILAQIKAAAMRSNSGHAIADTPIGTVAVRIFFVRPLNVMKAAWRLDGKQISYAALMAKFA